MGEYGDSNRKWSSNSLKSKLSKRAYIQIPREEIGYFKFILESYEYLCYMSVIDRFKSIIKISYLSDQKEELISFFHAL